MKTEEEILVVKRIEYAIRGTWFRRSVNTSDQGILVSAILNRNPDWDQIKKIMEFYGI